jgi:Zn-dependent protease
MSGPNPSYYYYTTTTVPAPQVHHTTSGIEIRDLTIAFAVLTFDLMVIIGSLSLFAGVSSLAGFLSLRTFAIAATAAVTGFLAHELAHKFVAQRYHAWAEFRMSPVGLVVSVLTATFGFLFAAPGATVVGGMTDLREWGRTSLAGPMTNLAFAFVFLAGALVAGLAQLSAGAIGVLLWLTFFNGWFATFNLLPFGPLDGAKVRRWNTSTWAVAIVVCGLTTIVGALFLYGQIPVPA